MDDLSLADLGVFTLVATLGTLSAAARKQAVDVSQVSRAIDRIERACGAKLLRRSARGLSLTQEGDAFLAFCQGVGARRHDVEADFAHLAREVSGRVRLSLSTVIAQHWVVPSIPALVAKNPKLGLELSVNDDLVDIVRDGIDIAIRTGAPMALSMVAHPLGRIETGLFASAGYLDRAGVPKNPADLQQHVLLSNCAHPVLNRLVFKSGQVMVAEGLLRAGSTVLVAEMAAHGLGIAHLPLQVARHMAHRGKLMRVLDHEFVSAAIEVNAIALPDRHRLPRVRASLEHLRHLFATPRASSSVRAIVPFKEASA